MSANALASRHQARVLLAQAMLPHRLIRPTGPVDAKLEVA